MIFSASKQIPPQPGDFFSRVPGAIPEAVGVVHRRLRRRGRRTPGGGRHLGGVLRLDVALGPVERRRGLVGKANGACYGFGAAASKDTFLTFWDVGCWIIFFEKVQAD